MAEVIKQEDYDQLPAEVKNNTKISVIKWLEVFLMAIEFVCMVVYSIVMINEQFPFNDILSIAAKIVFPCILVGLSLILVIAQKILFGEIIKAYQTDTIKDDILSIVFFSAITVIICLADWQGAEMSLKHIRSYQKNEKSTMQDDSHVAASTRKESNSKREQAARDKAKSDLEKCPRCEAIKAEYAAKIKPHQRSANPAWVKLINQSIDNQNVRTIANRDAAIAKAKAEIAEANDKIIAQIVNEVSDADKQVAVASSSIIEHNKEEEKKRKKRDEQNEAFAMYVTPITQPLLFILRIMFMSLLRKMGYTIHQVIGFFKITKYFQSLTKSISIYFDEMIEKADMEKREKEIISVKKMVAHRDKIIASHGTEYEIAFNAEQALNRNVLRKIALDTSKQQNGNTSEFQENEDFHTGEEDKKKSEIIEENSEIMEENDGNLQGDEDNSDKILLISQVVEHLKNLLGTCDENQSPIIFQTIAYLEDLKNSL